MRWLDNMKENIKRGLRSWLISRLPVSIISGSKKSWTSKQTLSGTGSGTVATATSWFSSIISALNMRTSINSGRQSVHREWKCARSIPVYLV